MLTGWPVTAEAVSVFTSGLPDALFIQHIKHVPLAQRLAERAEVAWGGGSSIEAAIAALERRGAQSDRVGVIGPMTFEQHEKLAARFGAPASLNRRYVQLRQIKSAEEIAWMRIGAAVTDRGMAALRDGLRNECREKKRPRETFWRAPKRLQGRGVRHRRDGPDPMHSLSL
jgi:Xaa-Pro aminopeptidase